MYLKHQPGDIIQDKYRITGILGQGGVAITYSAINLETEDSVAVKVISLKQLDNWKQVELFGREAEVLSKLDHPAIPKHIDYFDLETDTDKAFYIVQQQAPGKSLFDLVQSGWRTTEAQVKDIAQQVLAILSYLHSLDPPVIHRDIKPNNLIRSDDGKIYLVDFGAVQNTYYNTLMQGSTVVGTYGYMAPEQFRGKALPASDLYSLGATLLYLLTHRSPAELPQDTLKLDFRNSIDISESFADWLDKILEPDIEDRFADANEALTQLFLSKKKHKRKLVTNITAGILTVGLIFSINSHKWLLLSRLGFYPAEVCSTRVMQNYFKQGGYINAVDSKNITNVFSTIIRSETTATTIKRLRDTNNISQIVNQKNTCRLGKDKTLLHAAISEKNHKVIKQLFEYGADANVQHGYVMPVIFDAISSGNLDIVKLLIEHGASINATDNLGNTPLFNTVSEGYPKLVKLLIDYGADVNVKNKINETPLFVAVSKGNIAIVKMLIANDADINIKNNKGETPLSNAIFSKHKNIAKLLVEHGAINNQFGQLEIFQAVEKSLLDAVMRLVIEGDEVNVRDEDFKTPLFHAAIRGNKDIAKLLIDYGADINAQDNSGKTPLHYSASKGFVDVSRLLIERGAKINLKDKQHKDPLFFAIIEQNKDILKLLVDNGSSKHYLDFKNIEKLLADQNHSNRNRIKNFLNNNQFSKQ